MQIDKMVQEAYASGSSPMNTMARDKGKDYLTIIRIPKPGIDMGHCKDAKGKQIQFQRLVGGALQTKNIAKGEFKAIKDICIGKLRGVGKRAPMPECKRVNINIYDYNLHLKAIRELEQSLKRMNTSFPERPYPK